MRNALVLLGVLLAVCVAYAYVETVDINREDVQRAGVEAARGLSKKFSGKYQHRLVRIVKAKAQELRGNEVEYIMHVIVGMTQCLKTEEDNQDCEFQDNASTYKKCDVQVLRNSAGDYKLTYSGCILASRDEI